MTASNGNRNLLESFHILYLRFLGSDKSWSDFWYAKFLGGALFGGFLVLLPLLYSDTLTWNQLTYLQLGVGLLVVVSCGMLSAKLGDRFFDAVMKGFGNSGF